MVQPAEVRGHRRLSGHQVVGTVQVQGSEPVREPADAKDGPPATVGAEFRGFESDRQDGVLPGDGEVFRLLDLGRRYPGFC